MTTKKTKTFLEQHATNFSCKPSLQGWQNNRFRTINLQTMVFDVSDGNRWGRPEPVAGRIRSDPVEIPSRLVRLIRETGENPFLQSKICFKAFSVFQNNENWLRKYILDKISFDVLNTSLSVEKANLLDTQMLCHEVFC